MRHYLKCESIVKAFDSILKLHFETRKYFSFCEILLEMNIKNDFTGTLKLIVDRITGLQLMNEWQFIHLLYVPNQQNINNVDPMISCNKLNIVLNRY